MDSGHEWRSDSHWPNDREEPGRKIYLPQTIGHDFPLRTF